MSWKNSYNQEVKQSNVTQFMDIASIPYNVAQDILRKHNNNLQEALDYFFNNPDKFVQYQRQKGNLSKLQKLFSKYNKGNDKELSGESLFSFLKDCGVDPKSRASFIIPWKLQSKQLGVITKKQFEDGLSKMGCDNVQRITQEINIIEDSLSDKTVFKSFYMFLFDYFRAGEEIKRSVDFKVVVALWPVIFNQKTNKYPHLEPFIEYLKEKDVKVISRDLWNQFADFLMTVKPDFSNYNINDAWPTMIDDYVETQMKK